MTSAAEAIPIDSCLLAVASRGLSSVCGERQRSLRSLPLLIRTSVPLRDPTLTTSLNLALSPNRSLLELELQLTNFGVTQFRP